MARTLWWSSCGKVMIDLDAVVCVEWRPTEEGDEEPFELDVAFVGSSDVNVHVNTFDERIGNEIMSALRQHAGWPEGSPYRG